MPEQRDLAEQVITLVVAFARYRPEQQITEQTRLVADLGYDSLRLLELSVAAEQRFGLPPIEMGAALSIETVEDAIRQVADLLAVRP